MRKNLENILPKDMQPWKYVNICLFDWSTIKSSIFVFLLVHYKEPLSGDKEEKGKRERRQRGGK